MRALLMAFVAMSTGCGCLDRGDKQVVDPAQKYLLAGDQTLPTGTVGSPYDAALQLSGGDPPYAFAPADNKIPIGLELTEVGHVKGVPAEAGDFSFAVAASDSKGRSTRIQVAMQVVLEPNVVECGDTVNGAFQGSAYTVDGPDLTDLPNVAWMAVELPDDLTTRVDLQFAMTGSATLYVEFPTEVVGSGNIDDHYYPYYLSPGYTPMNVPIDAGSTPSLSGFQTQPLLPMVLVGQGSNTWSLTVECTDGPIFTTLPQYPTRLGDPLEIDFDVYGDNTGVRIWTEDPLPEWMIWDEATGTVTGTAEEPGAWEFTVFAETADGRKREERSIIGVYEVFDVGCDQSVPLTTEEGYLDGEFYAFYDPRGFGVYRLPLVDVEPSSVTLRVEGADGHYLGLSTPNPEWLRFYGGAERLYLNDPVVELGVTPRTYPAIRNYLDPLVGELYFSAGSIGSDYEMSVSVDCDDGPRPNLAALPVVEPLAEVAYPLDAIGGTEPYSWEASSLPSGLALDGGGVLEGQTGAIGTYDVTLAVGDKVGSSTSEDYVLYVGDDEACRGYHKISCGESVDGDFDEAYYNDGNGKKSTEVFCVVARDELGLGWEVYSDAGQLRLDIADPGASADEMFDQAKGTYVEWVDFGSSVGVPLDPFSWPKLADYENLPVLFAVRAYDPGGWTVHLVCQ
ncbi:MAG: Ig domain-containing protein [Myxococcota bacterium]